MGKIYNCKVEQDGDDYVIVFPDELLKEWGAVEGDEIEWAVHDDGSVHLKKVVAENK